MEWESAFRVTLALWMRVRCCCCSLDCFDWPTTFSSTALDLVLQFGSTALLFYQWILSLSTRMRRQAGGRKGGGGGSTSGGGVARATTRQAEERFLLQQLRLTGFRSFSGTNRVVLGNSGVVCEGAFVVDASSGTSCWMYG